VLEIAGLAPAPFCGMILADFGANVIRIDRYLHFTKLHYNDSGLVKSHLWIHCVEEKKALRSISNPKMVSPL
jgi:crotonobetainyl-CoA:carnitine CoA-transferase CaiB-like acyl-CoA transferase